MLLNAEPSVIYRNELSPANLLIKYTSLKQKSKMSRHLGCCQLPTQAGSFSTSGLQTLGDLGNVE